MDDLGDKKGIGNLDNPKMPYDYSKREYGTVPLDTSGKRSPFQWVSEVAYKNVHRIVSRGYDTTELMEEGYGVVDVLFVDFQARIPLIEEEKMLNYIMVLALEDGLSIPAAISRLVARSKTFLTQACGASVLAFGHAYGAYSAFGNRLEEYLAKTEEENLTLAQAARLLVEENMEEEGLGVSRLMLHDPAAVRVFARAEKLGVSGKNIAFMKEIIKVAQEISQQSLALDMLGAIGATMMDLGFTPEATWAIMACTRAFAAGAHYIEELEREEYVELGQELTSRSRYDGTPDRPVPTLEERTKIAQPAQAFSLKEWKAAIEKRKNILGSGFSIVEEIEDPSKKSGTRKVGR